VPFEFSLRGLLRLRRVQERRERMRLALLNSSRARARNEFEEAQQQGLLAFEELNRKLQAGIPGAEFRLEHASLQPLAKRRRELEALAEALELQMRKQIEVFGESQKKRKVLESLRDRQRKAFEQIENRREQQRIDDLFARRRMKR
jgi:flagellar export protein FliJ